MLFRSLDMARTWERIVRRAGLPMAYSEGFNPQPRLSFAAALPVGCTSDQEVLDVILSELREPAEIHDRLNQAAPEGITVLDVSEVPYSTQALQTQTRAAEFVVTLLDPITPEDAHERVQTLVNAESLVRTRRDKTYDLRPLILDMSVEANENGQVQVRMMLKAEESGTGRPDEVVAALGMDVAAVRIHRRRLIFAQDFGGL